MKFYSLDKIKITFPESKFKLGRSGKGFITSLGIKAKLGPHKCKKARFAIKDVSKNYLSKIIKEFEKLRYESYEKKRPQHEPTGT